MTFIHGLKNCNAEQVSTALVISDSTDVWVAESSFLGNEDTLSRAILAQYSRITILSCNFEDNSADDGRAIYASNGTNITLDGSNFVSNQADRVFWGCYIHAKKSSIVMEEVIGNTYIFNSAANGEALYCEESNCSIKTSNYNPPFSKVSFNLNVSMVNQHVAYFGNNSAINGGAVHLYNSFATFQGTALIIESNMAALAGGAIYSSGSHVIISATNSVFISNTAYDDKSDNTTSNKNTLQIFEILLGNDDPRGGGAIFSLKGSLTLAGNSLYNNNNALIGGAMIIVRTHFVASGKLSMSFNQAKYGGAIMSTHTDMLFHKTIVNFLSNSARISGGAIATLNSKLLSHNSKFYFIAFMFGGGVYSTDGTILQLASATFTNNTSTAEAGGTIFIHHEKNVKLHNISISGSTYSALSIAESNISISGTTILSNNIGVVGGAMHLIHQFPHCIHRAHYH